MRYRNLDKTDDMVFGSGSLDYLSDSPECVAQAVLTRLKLWRGEWFLDNAEGTPYKTEVLGKYTASTYAQALRKRVLATPNVLSIDEFAGSINTDTREITVSMTITTSFGTATIKEVV